MNRWSWIAVLSVSVLAASLLTASCGISGKTKGKDPDKSELAIIDLRAVPTDTSAVISWHTPMQTAGTLSWGPVGGTPGRTVSSTPAGEHVVTLPDLASDTRYWYQVAAAAPLGDRVTSLPDTFRTLVDPDVYDSTPPVITGLKVVGVTSGSATVVWSTDDRTIGLVFYGFNAGTYGSTATDSAAYGRSRCR